MKRKLIIDRCWDCPYVERKSGLTSVDGWSGVRCYCIHPQNGNVPKEVKIDSIPNWCPLDHEDS